MNVAAADGGALAFLGGAVPLWIIAAAGVVLLVFWGIALERAAFRERVRGIDLDPRFGTVYVFRHGRHGRLVKIGFTRRDPETRAAEVSEDMAGGDPLTLVARLDTHQASAVETAVHRRMASRRRRRRRASGREWFSAPGRRGLRRVEREMLAAARDVRRAARRAGKWPRGADERSRLERVDGGTVRPFVDG